MIDFCLLLDLTLKAGGREEGKCDLSGIKKKMEEEKLERTRT